MHYQSILVSLIAILILGFATSADRKFDRRKSFLYLRARSQGSSTNTYFSPVKNADKASTPSDDNLQLTILTSKVLNLEKRLEELTKKLQDASKLVKCVQGPPGRDGMNGRDGLAGPPGRDGMPGRDGRDAIAAACPKVPEEIFVQGQSKFSRVRRGKFESGDLQSTEMDVNSTYVRWGHTACPQGAGTSLLMSGRVTITYSADPKYKCDSDNHAVQTRPASFSLAQSHGVEYQVKNRNPWQGQKLQGQDVACSVCNLRDRDTVVMFPNYRVCPSGWSLEYGGYLMSENWNHIRTENICVDSNAEKSKNLPFDEHTATISPLESFCNGKPCGSEMDETFVKCVVCSRDAL